MNVQMSFVWAVAFTLLHSLWQLALIGLLAAASFSAMAGATARARHAVGMVCLVAMLAAPLATFMLYSHSPSPGLANASWWMGAWAPADGGAPRPAAMPAAPWQDWLSVCLAQVWLAGVAVMAVRQVGGWRLMRHIERQPYAALPAEWQQRVAKLAAALGITRRVSVRLAQRVGSPFTAHALRPLIWLPLGLLTRLPADQIEALLAHELAHIRRLDWCWNAIQCAIEPVLFHHPAMWWLSRRIREEREHACDDLAVAVCGDAVALAEALTGLQRRGRSIGIATPGLAAEGGTLMKRISHLLSAVPARPNWRVPAVLLLLLCGGSLVALQAAPPGHLLIDLMFDASSRGELTPGNYREYTASYVGEQQRRYRISMDAQGHVDEVYTEGGERRPIDADVRLWLRAMTAMNAPPAPPLAPAPPKPLPALAPPAAGSDESVVLTETIRSDPRLVAVTGQPVTFDRKSFHGSIHTWGARDFHLWGIDDPVGGKASFSMTFEGPGGRALVAYAGKTTTGGVWKADTLDIAPLPR